MPQQIINNTPANGGTGDSPFVYTTKINANFGELYTRVTALESADSGFQPVNARLTALINGTIDNVSIGGTTASTGSFTTARAISFIGPLTGSATSLAVARTIALAGDIAGSATFDGSANVTITAALGNSGISPATYGTASQVPAVTFDIKGRATAASQIAIAIPSTAITDSTSLGRSVLTATTGTAARTAIGAAESGANSTITSLTGLTTPLSVGQGGTGGNTQAMARSGLGAAASGVNTDITSLAGPALGAATATTPAAGDNSTRVATTASVQTAIAAVTGGASFPIRQTVASGPASAGLPAFLPATSGSLSLTAQNVTSGAPLVVTAATGFAGTGATNSTYVFTSNPTWSLVASTTNYLYINTATGATGITGQVPVYQAGGAQSTNQGQFTFDTVAMIGYMGNGSAAVPTPLVFIGEAVASASAVTSTIAYAYNGSYDSGWTATLPAAASTTTLSHNLGVQPRRKLLIAEATTAEFGYAVGEQIGTDSGLASQTSQPAQIPLALSSTRNAVMLLTSTNTAWVAIGRADNSTVTLTRANWRWRIIAQRAF